MQVLGTGKLGLRCMTDREDIHSLARPQLALNSSHFHQWLSPDGAPWAMFYRQGDNYLIRFVDQIDFLIDGVGGNISAFPVPAVPAHIAQHLYMNFARPFALSLQDALVLHASAIEIEDFAFVFVGDSGSGKSTLTANFCKQGNRFLGDDGVQIEGRETAYSAIPNHPSIRLWSDSRTQWDAAGFSDNSDRRPDDKYCLTADPETSFCDEAKPLGCIYFLGTGNTSSVAIEKMTSAKALVAMLQHSFLLDVASRDSLGGHFNLVSQFAKSDTSFYALDYPREYDMIPEVCESITAHAMASVG